MENEQSKFEAYVAVQESGSVNMFDVRNVCMLSDDVLDRDDCKFIMANYDELKAKYA